eukprot:gnl/Dysnectes_brevis/7185_a11807_453.p1 GENE.gnl/Dysnectes_brevis/7185_a11807_453~~gnl/Dysnectes_brevis/7185_a11807_453.p1  ORF type:complete len:209 (+),score=10.60 gnl/Dysnectes_brevis/7185_a11807_453:68-628(+)
MSVPTVSRGIFHPIDKPKITRIKVMTVGEPKSGKSTLIKRFCEGRFIQRYISTIGIDYGVRGVTIDDKMVKVNFFDTGGLPEYASIRNEFYKDVQGLLLVYDQSSRPSFAVLQRWLEEVRTHQHPERSPVLYVIAAKGDQPARVKPAEGKRFADKISASFFTVSAQSGDGITRMFMEMFTEILKNQ